MKKKSLSLKDAHKSYESKAKKYMKNSKSRDNLFKSALGKAVSNKNSLGDAKDQVTLLVAFVKAWYRKEYRSVSKSTILSVVAALVYFVSPIDLIPDFILGLGLVDDIAVLGFAYKRVSKDLEKFKLWKETQIPLKSKSDYVQLHRDK